MDVSTTIIAIIGAICSISGWAAFFLLLQQHRHGKTASVKAHLQYSNHVGDPYPCLVVRVISTGGRVLHKLKVQLVKKLRDPVARGREARERRGPIVQMYEDRFQFNAVRGDEEVPLHPRQPRDFVMSMRPPLFTKRVWQDVPSEDVHISVSHVEGELCRIPGETVKGHFKLWDDDEKPKPFHPPGMPASIFKPAQQIEPFA